MTPSIHSAVLSELRAVAAMMDEMTAADERSLADVIHRGSEWQTRRAGVDGAIRAMEGAGIDAATEAVGMRRTAR